MLAIGRCPTASLPMGVSRIRPGHLWLPSGGLSGARDAQAGRGRLVLPSKPPAPQAGATNTAQGPWSHTSKCAFLFFNCHDWNNPDLSALTLDGEFNLMDCNGCL